MKKGMILATLMLSIMIFGISKVKALQVGDAVYSTPSSFALYNNISATSSQQVTITRTSMPGSNLGIVYANGTVTTTSGSSSPGASWCFSTDLNFMQGYIYSVQMVVASGNNRSYTIPTLNNYDMLRIGYSLADASTHSGTTTIMFFGASVDSYGAYANGTLIKSPVTVMQYIFESKLNATYICLPFKHTVDATNENEMFFGVKVDMIGQANLVTNSSLNAALGNVATTSQVQQLQQQTEATTNAVNNQTDSILNNDTTYNNNASETLNGQTEMDNLDQSESNLLGSLDFSEINNLNIIINPEASQFIWRIAEQLRGMNGAIALLITSILGLGIIKMILNR